MGQITSIKDPRIVLARDLQTSEGRRKHHSFLLYGLEQIKWALESGVSILYVFGEKDILGLAVPVLQVSSGILKKISGTNYLIPYIAVAKIPIISAKTSDFLVVLDNIQDYGNLGTIIRTANGLFVDNFVLSNPDADPFQRKVIDSSRGAVFQSSLKVESSVQSAIDNLKKSGYQLIVTSPHAKNLQSQTPLKVGKPIALVVGNESRGVDEEFIKQADVVIQIPMSKSIESLNVGVAAGISIYELKFRQVLLMLKEKIFANFGREVNVLGKYIQMAFDAEISRVTKLSGKQVILLMIMHCDQTMSEVEITKDTGLHGSELEHFLKPLADRRMVIQEQNNYKLTSDGEKFLAEIWPIVEQAQQKLFEQLTEQEISNFMRTMEKIKNSCISMIESRKES
jgi:RNA methyltransferase, TrmH family